MLQMLRTFLGNKSGATAIEYGLIAALISVVIIGAVGTIGGELGEAFDYIATQLSSASAGSGGTQ